MATPKAWLAFTQVCSATNSPGLTPNGVTSKAGQTWQPQEAKLYNGTWYLKGSSGWWPALCNKAVVNGKPVTIAASNRGITQPCVRVKGTANWSDFDQQASVVDFEVNCGGWTDLNGAGVTITG